MRARRFGAAAGALAAIIIAGCTFSPLASSVPPYDSRILEYHPYNPNGTVDSNPAITVVYDSTGKAAGRFESTYDSQGNPSRTNLYQYDSAGAAKTLIGYYLYTYNTSANPELVTKGEAYDANGNPKEYYTVSYANGTGLTDHYTDIADYSVDSSGTATQTADHVVTYITDTNNTAEGDYRTEQYFTFDSSGTESLQKEYAAYYLPPDANGTVNEQAELYHVLRNANSNDSSILPKGKDEAYFYTKFSYDSQENTYLQTDSLYGDAATAADLPTDLRSNGGIYDSTTSAYKPNPAWNTNPAAGNPEPFPYLINSTYIGNQVDMILWQFDGYNNPTAESLYAYGALQETRTYTWKDSTHVAVKNLFVNGGTSLQQRDVTNYYDAVVGGVTYQVWDTTTYYFGLAPAKHLGPQRPLFFARNGLKSLPSFNPAGMNDQDLLATLGQRMFQNMAALHE